MTLMDVAEHKKTGKEWFQEGRDNYKRTYLNTLKKALECFEENLLKCTDDACREQYETIIKDLKELLKTGIIE